MKTPTRILVLFCLLTLLVQGQNNIEEKIENLLSKMTIDEKIGQLQQGFNGSDNIENGIVDGKFGSFLNAGDIETKIEYQKLAVNESRLGIPLIFGRDVIHGYRTVFPIPLGQSATWNPDLVKKAAEIAAYEASEQGIHWTFAPMIDIARDPRWGRIAESPGEDPYLVSVMAKAMVEGFQGESLSNKNSIAACAKHFAGYGAAEGGRDYNTTLIPENELRNIYLRPFKAAKDAGVATYMSAFNDLNGVPTSGNKFTLKQVLRNEWGFDGFVVSDWGSMVEMIIHGYCESETDVAKVAIEAGVDMEMVSQAYANELKKLIEEGLVDIEYLNTAVKNILRVKFRLGLFDNPFPEYEGESALLKSENLEFAKKVAHESLVLLKNDNVLPLSNTLNKIAVIGPLANSGRDQNGTWAPDGKSEDAVTPLTALRERFNDRIVYEAGLKTSRSTDIDNDAVLKAVQQSDVVLLFVGEEEIIAGEAKSRAFLNFPGKQKELIELVSQSNKPTIIIILAGRPLTFSAEAELVDAILFAWHPGTMGGPAIADVLFGDYSPSGKLPVTFPRTVGQVPYYYNHRNTGRPAPITYEADIPLGTPLNPKDFVSNYLDVPNSPGYPFGFGLSYAEFEYDDLSLSSTKIAPEENILVSLEVTNKSDIQADEIIQLYIRDRVGSITRPVKELKDFKKETFSPNETKIITFTLDKEDLSFYNYENKLVVEPGKFDIWVGPNSAEGLHAEFIVK